MFTGLPGEIEMRLSVLLASASAGYKCMRE